jgi:hypothetical protein
MLRLGMLRLGMLRLGMLRLGCCAWAVYQDAPLGCGNEDATLISQYRKARYLVAVTLRVAKLLGGLRVVERGQFCHSERVSSSTSVAARRQ